MKLKKIAAAALLSFGASLAQADTVKMELNTGISPAIIVPVEGEENFLYMVLPVRLKAN